jgi:hypothetical protein
MFMRFRGGGIGHKSTQERTRVFEQQSHILPPELDEALAVDDGVDSEDSEEESEEENEAEELSDDEARGDEMGGGEDGEEPWDEDVVEVEGYAQL